MAERRYRSGAAGRTWMPIAGLAVAAVLVRAAFLAQWPQNFDADEALVGVHAQQILRGHLTLFLPGQS